MFLFLSFLSAVNCSILHVRFGLGLGLRFLTLRSDCINIIAIIYGAQAATTTTTISSVGANSN